MDPVSFNVGGKIFQASRYLLDKHSDTMLGSVSSGYDSPEPIFLDGDAALFAQVLIYLRHGSITLPVTISKAMFVKELEYYDVAIAPGSVESESGGSSDLNSLFREYYSFKSGDSGAAGLSYDLASFFSKNE